MWRDLHKVGQVLSSTDVGAPRFVGRDDELRRVADALGRPPAVVLVEGEAGIGKSRLVREALAMAGAGSPRWLIAVCPPFREGLTLGPIVDAARQAVASGIDFAELGCRRWPGRCGRCFPNGRTPCRPRRNRWPTRAPPGTG